jgi:hypothetical protein
VGLLVARSLIELVQNEYDSFAYKVHDVMRDLALHITEGENPITCLYRPGKELVKFPRDWIWTFESELYEVRKLSLMENDLATLNDVFFSAPKLEVLLLAENKELQVMPKQFLKGIENLKLLDLSQCCELKSLPREIGKLKYLTHLYLEGCAEFKSLPKAIGNLRQLTHLNLNRCRKFESLPKEIGKLTRLTHLELNWCEKLQSLPKEVGELTQLVHLNLEFCRALKYHPSTIGNLKSLQYLNLAVSSPNGYWGNPSWQLHGQTFAA